MPQNPSPYMQLYNAYRLPGHVHHGHGQTGQRHMPAPPNLPGLLTIMRDATTEDDLMRMRAVLESMNGDGPASNTGLPQPDGGPFSPVPAAYQQHPVENYPPSIVRLPQPDSGLFSPMPAAYQQIPSENYIPPVVGQPGPDSGLFSPMPAAYQQPPGQNYIPPVVGQPQPDSGLFSPVPAAYQQSPPVKTIFRQSWGSQGRKAVCFHPCPRIQVPTCNFIMRTGFQGTCITDTGRPGNGICRPRPICRVC